MIGILAAGAGAGGAGGLPGRHRLIRLLADRRQGDGRRAELISVLGGNIKVEPRICGGKPHQVALCPGNIGTIGTGTATCLWGRSELKRTERHYLLVFYCDVSLLAYLPFYIAFKLAASSHSVRSDDMRSGF